MPINSINIEGYRGFATPQNLEFAQSDEKKEGSGITFLFGANNSGKSALLESLKFFAGHRQPELSKSQRNDKKDRRISIKLKHGEDLESTISTNTSGGSTTVFQGKAEIPSIFYLPSKRFIHHTMGRNNSDRNSAAVQMAEKGRDNQQLNYFPGRLFTLLLQNDRLASYNGLLKKILGYELKWTIDLDNGSHFIQYELSGLTHTSEGAGDGIINLMIIADALHDAHEGSMIVIDEPEVSLHPSAQKRLYLVLKEFSKKLQIVIATHSPYFVDFDAIAAGARAARLYKEDDEIRIAQLPKSFSEEFKNLLSDTRNPHLLGTDAKEIFFATDGVLLVEGQDDVICITNASKDLSLPLQANIFGWGVGGESKMKFFAKLLHALNYKKVFGLLDNGASSFQALKKEYKQYHFHQISTEDIRDKAEEKAKAEKSGLFDTRYHLKESSKIEVNKLINLINSKLA